MSSYTIPHVIAQHPRGERIMDVYSHLLTERVVYLGTAIDAVVANALVAQLLFLEADNPDRDIQLYINCEGGDPSAMLAVHDAFDIAKRQLQDYVRRQREAGGESNRQPRGHVARIFPVDEYGYLTAEDGHEVYFQKSSVLNGDFEHLEVDNPEFLLALLDARPIAGTRAVFDQFASAFHQADTHAFILRSLLSLIEARHAGFNDTLYQLEPDVKEAPGALRDLFAAQTIAKLTVPDLLRQGGPDSRVLEDAEEFLLRVRSVLHAETRRHHGILSHELQEKAGGIPFWTPSTAVLAGLEAFGSLKKISVLTPYWPPAGDLVSMLAHGEATRDMNQFEYLGNIILLTIGFLWLITAIANHEDRRKRHCILDRNRNLRR